MVPVNLFMFLGVIGCTFFYSFSGGMTGRCEVSLSFLFDEHLSLPLLPPSPFTGLFPDLANNYGTVE